MAIAWSGSQTLNDNNDVGTQYELGEKFTINEDLTISAIRIYQPTGQSPHVPITDRKANFWSAAGVNQAQIDIPDSLTEGWAEYVLDTPRQYVSGSVFWLTYGLEKAYGSLAGGYPRASSDGAVTITDGGFSLTRNTFITNTTSTFYGVDFVYTLGLEQDDPPVVSASVSVNAAVATLTFSAVTENPPVSWFIDWGDGQTTSGASSPATHTYAQSGIYPILVRATDAEDLQGFKAVAANFATTVTYDDAESWIDPIFDAVVSDFKRSGYFDRVNTHEPKRKPNTKLTAAIWLQSIDPLALASGLAATSARIVFRARLYMPMLKEPQDMIDPSMLRAASNLMRRFHDDFDFEGIIRNIDLLGQFGVALSGQAGYLEIDGTNFRIFDIDIPCIVNDVWPQVS